MARFQPGLSFRPSPRAVEIVRETLHRAGLPFSEADARELVEAILAVETPRMQAVSRGILHGSLETIRQTAEVALSALTEARPDQEDPAEVVKRHPGHEGAARRPVAARRRGEEEEQGGQGDDHRPVFKRPGRR
jgi:hypothetical protein